MPTVQGSIFPQRRKLPHEIPPWVEEGARHFITINCLDRGSIQLTRADRATLLLESILHYESLQRWYIWLAVLMPDHLHMILTFDLRRGIRQVLSPWKSYQSKHLHIEWQQGFFEHRLRNMAEFDEKAYYVRMNPVRKGLVPTPEQWPYCINRTAQPEASPYPGNCPKVPR